MTISFSNEEAMFGRIEIFNQVGEKVFVQNLEIEPGGEGVLDIARLPQGAYFLQTVRENQCLHAMRFFKSQ